MYGGTARAGGCWNVWRGKDCRAIGSGGEGCGDDLKNDYLLGMVVVV
jgi:hypothetical protein